jgi:hypothetical protein
MRICEINKNSAIRYKFLTRQTMHYKVTLWRVSITFVLLSYPNSLIPFHSKSTLLRRFHVASNNKTYLDLHVKYPVFLPDFNQVRIFSTHFHKSPQYQLHGNPFIAIRADACGHTDGHSEGNRHFLRLC